MQAQRRVYRSGLVVQLAGWGLLLGFGGGLLVLLANVVMHFGSMPADERWSALWLGLFLLAIALLGGAALRSGFVIGADYIEVVRVYGSRRFAAAELAGYGTIVLVVNLVPMLLVRLYAPGPKEIAKFAVSFADRADVERWLAARLPVVDDPGSIARPRPRFRRDAR